MNIQAEPRLIKPKRGDYVKITNTLYFMYHGMLWVKMTQEEIDQLEDDKDEKLV